MLLGRMEHRGGPNIRFGLWFRCRLPGNGALPEVKPPEDIPWGVPGLGRFVPEACLGWDALLLARATSTEPSTEEYLEHTGTEAQ